MWQYVMCQFDIHLMICEGVSSTALPYTAVLESVLTTELGTIDCSLRSPGEAARRCPVHLDGDVLVVVWGLISASRRNVFGLCSENSSVLH